jgi:hypothetical protein
MRIDADIRTAHWVGPKHHGSFRPNGKLLVEGREAIANPHTWDAKGPIWAARLFVGFNVGNKPRWNVDDLMKVVRRVRKKQKRKPDASFVAQKGIYTSSRTGKSVEEKGAQVIILNTEGGTMRAFEAEILELAEEIARALKQEEVVVEIQKGGLVKKTFGVEP